MSTLTLVRHGQASYGQADYDQLTPLGVEQARGLGAWWAQRGFSPDRVYVGPCRRHEQTWAAAKQAFDEHPSAASEGSSGLPAPMAAEALNEYSAIEVMHHVPPKLANEDPLIARWIESMGQGAAGEDHQQLFKQVLEHVMLRYARGELAAMMPSIESFAGIRQRINDWLEREAQSAGRGVHLVAFSSGGRWPLRWDWRWGWTTSR